MHKSEDKRLWDTTLSPHFNKKEGIVVQMVN